MKAQSILYNLLGVRHKLFNIFYFVFSIFNRIIPLNKYKILIYDPDFDKFDNTGALYDYLIEEKYFEKYLIINVCKNYKILKQQKINNVIHCGKIRGIIHYLSSCYVYYRAATVRIKPKKGQQVIQMWHGSPCKGVELRMKKRNWTNPYYTCAFSSSENFKKIFSQVFSLPESQLKICGQPRTDVLFKTWEKYDLGSYKKIVLWTPTFRKYKKTRYGMGKQVENEDKLVPIIEPDKFEEVDEHLKRIDIKVVVKLHPMQSLEQYQTVNMNNFILLSDFDFKSRGMDLYKFMTQCDAMITDYSSIYWDFLVLDRPIGFTEDDMEDYGSVRGFVMDNPSKYKPGTKLKTLKDFYQFIDDLAVGIDNYKEQRSEMNRYGNPVTDGHSCKRALECVGITL